MALKSLVLGRRCCCPLWYVILILFLLFRQAETETLGSERLYRVAAVVDATAIKLCCDEFAAHDPTHVSKLYHEKMETS